MTPDAAVADLLVVDDEPFLRDAVAASLRFLGFGVTAAENGTDALRLTFASLATEKSKAA